MAFGASGRTSRLLKKFVARAIVSMSATATTGLMSNYRRYKRGIRYVFASSSTLQTDSSRRSQNLRDADHIIGGCGEYEEPFHQVAPAMAGLAQAPGGLDPAERLLDPLALDCADPIAGVAGGARIDRRAAVGVVLRDMRRAAAFTAAGDKVGSVIVLVTAHGAAGSGIVLDHVERGGALGRAVGLGQPRIDDEAVAVLHHQVAHVAELGLL